MPERTIPEQGGQRSPMQFGFGIGGAKKAIPNEAVPFRILILGDFGGTSADGPQGLSLRGEVPANLSEQLQASAAFTVPNLLGSTPDPLPVDLPIRRMADFSAKTLTAVLEPLRRAAALRSAIAGGLRTFDHYADLDRLVAKLGPPPPPRRAASPAPSEVDRLLSILDLGDGEPNEPALLPGAGPKSAVATIDDLVAQQLALVRGHPRLAALEATWRGLRLLTGAGLPPGVEIDLLDLEPGAAPATLIRDIVPDELEQTDRAHLACILVLGPIPGTEDGLQQLALCAAAGAALQTPVIVSLDQAFFDTPDELRRAGWQMLRTDDSAAWLATCAGDIVLAAEGRDQPLWGEPAWAVAALAVASMKQYGWPNELANPSAMTLDGIEVHEITGRTGPAAWPLRRPLTRTEAAEQAANGVLTLAAQANRDRLFLATAPCLAPDTDLAAQLMAARVLAFLHAAAPQTGHDADADAAQAIGAALNTFLSGVGRVTDVQAKPGSRQFTIKAQLGASSRTTTISFNG